MRTFLCLLLVMQTAAAAASEVQASLQWSRRTELAMPVSGVVAAVPVNAGQRVAKGQVLVSLDDAPFQADLHAAEAQVARRQSERSEVARDAKQAQELYDRTVLSTVEIENAKMKLARADAAVQEAKAILDRARYRQRLSVIRAPFESIVLSRHIEPGQTIAAELKPPVLLVICAADEFLALARVSAERAAKFKLGQTLRVTVGGKTYDAHLKALTHEPTNGKEPYILEAVFSATESLYAGQVARLELP